MTDNDVDKAWQKTREHFTVLTDKLALAIKASRENGMSYDQRNAFMMIDYALIDLKCSMHQYRDAVDVYITPQVERKE